MLTEHIRETLSDVNHTRLAGRRLHYRGGGCGLLQVPQADDDGHHLHLWNPLPSPCRHHRPLVPGPYLIVSDLLCVYGCLGDLHGGSGLVHPDVHGYCTSGPIHGYPSNRDRAERKCRLVGEGCPSEHLGDRGQQFRHDPLGLGWCHHRTYGSTFPGWEQPEVSPRA